SIICDLRTKEGMHSIHQIPTQPNQIAGADSEQPLRLTSEMTKTSCLGATLSPARCTSSRSRWRHSAMHSVILAAVIFLSIARFATAQSTEPPRPLTVEGIRHWQRTGALKPWSQWPTEIKLDVCGRSEERRVGKEC